MTLDLINLSWMKRLLLIILSWANEELPVFTLRAQNYSLLERLLQNNHLIFRSHLARLNPKTYNNREEYLAKKKHRQRNKESNDDIRNKENSAELYNAYIVIDYRKFPQKDIGDWKTPILCTTVRSYTCLSNIFGKFHLIDICDS